MKHKSSKAHHLFSASAYTNDLIPNKTQKWIALLTCDIISISVAKKEKQRLTRRRLQRKQSNPSKYCVIHFLIFTEHPLYARHWEYSQEPDTESNRGDR